MFCEVIKMNSISSMIKEDFPHVYAISINQHGKSLFKEFQKENLMDIIGGSINLKVWNVLVQVVLVVKSYVSFLL